jgi:quinolinate synthase
MVRHILKTHQEIIFVPDKYLAQYVSSQVGHNFVIWGGYCPTHAGIIPEHIKRAREQHPQAKVIVHPECTPELTALADIVTSTEGMCKYVKSSADTEFIIGTEIGIIHRMQKENPQKRFHPAADKAICPNMKKITLEKVLWSLEDMTHEITVPQEIMKKAKLSIDRMLKIV